MESATLKMKFRKGTSIETMQRRIRSVLGRDCVMIRDLKTGEIFAK